MKQDLAAAEIKSEVWRIVARDYAVWCYTNAG